MCDIKKTAGGLIPSDFHGHWYGEHDSTIQPLLDPISAGRRHITNLRLSQTWRILSMDEEILQ